MRSILLALVAVAAAVFVAGEARAQCPGGRCAPQASSLTPQAYEARGIARRPVRKVAGRLLKARPLRRIAQFRPVRTLGRKVLRAGRAAVRAPRGHVGGRFCRGCR